MKPKTLSFQAWVKKYKPLKNPFDTHAACDGFLFNKYGDASEFVRNAAQNVVWSLTITDRPRTSYWAIGNGFSIVNLHGYLVTTVPWRMDEFLLVRY